MRMVGQVTEVHMLHPTSAALSQQAASRMEAAGWLMVGSHFFTTLFPQRAALWSESCHIFFISWGSPEGQVRGGAQMAGGWTSCCSLQGIRRIPSLEEMSGSVVSHFKCTGRTGFSALVPLGKGNAGVTGFRCLALLCDLEAGCLRALHGSSCLLDIEKPPQGVRQHL